MTLYDEILFKLYKKFPANSADQIWTYRVERIELNGAKVDEYELNNVVFVPSYNNLTIKIDSTSLGREEYIFGKTFTAFRNLLKKTDSKKVLEYGIRIIFKDDTCLFRNAYSTLLREENNERTLKRVEKLVNQYEESTIEKINQE